MKILVASGYQYWGNFLPSDLEEGEKQVGGGETAMIQISKELARLGHQVTVFYNVAIPGRYSGVDYLPIDLFVPIVCQMEHDVLVSWDAPHMFRFADRAALRVLAFQLNDTFIGPLDHTIDLYMHPSEWHAERFRGMYPEMTAHKQRPRITNGIDPTRYVSEVEVPREPHRVVYSSSPDRGLHHLLRVWPKVREVIPDAELHVFYEINKWLELVDEIVAKGLAVNTADRAEAVRQFATEHENYEEELGVFFHGGVGQARLAKEQLASAVLAYPCDPVQPTEGFSMTCLEAIASGCSLITTNADALQELWADAPNVTILPLPIDDNVWVETIVKELRAAETDPSRHEPILPKQYTWATIAQLWDQALKDALATRGQGNNGRQ